MYGLLSLFAFVTGSKARRANLPKELIPARLLCTYG